MDTSKQQFRPSLPKAFIIIELMVVVAIMALLVAILGPSVSGALDHAKGAICGNNLHEMAKMLLVDGSTGGQHDLPRPSEWTEFINERGGEDLLSCPEDSGEKIVDEVDLSDIWLVQQQGGSIMFSNLQTIMDTGQSPEDRQVTRVTSSHGHSAESGQALIRIGSECALSRITFRGDVRIESLIVSQTHSCGSTHWYCLDDGLPDWRSRVATEFYRGSSDPDVFVMRLQGVGYNTKSPDFVLGYQQASYAMSNAVNVRRQRVGQLMLVEYKKPIAYIRKGGFAVDELGDDNTDKRGSLRTRHLGKANVAMTDGTVKGFTREQLQAEYDMYTVADPEGLWAP